MLSLYAYEITFSVGSKKLYFLLIKLINCEPDTLTNSAISSGQYNPAANSGPATSSGLLNPYQKATSSQFSSSNVVVDSRKDILPNFQTLDIDFLNINPGDILVIIKNFIDLIFDKIEKLEVPDGLSKP